MNDEEFLDRLWAFTSTLEDENRDTQFLLRVGGNAVYMEATRLLGRGVGDE